MDDALVMRHFSGLYRRLRFLEDYKHMLPKFSCAVNDLASYYNLQDQRPPSSQSCVQHDSSVILQAEHPLLQDRIAARPRHSTP